MGHVEQEVREKAEASGVGMVAYHLQRIMAALDHHPAVERRPVPNLMVHEVIVVAPYFPDFAIVQQDGAVPDDVANGIDAQIEHFIDGLDVLPDAHGGLIEVDARMASVRLEDDLVLFGHGVLLRLGFVGWMCDMRKLGVYALASSRFA